MALLLGACGNREPEARAAFIALLQSRSEAAAGGPVALPSLSKKSGRRWAMRKPTASCRTTRPSCARRAAAARVLATETLRSVGDIVARHDDADAGPQDAAGQCCGRARARAGGQGPFLAGTAARSGAYDGVYDESLTAPANELLAAADTLDAVARDALAIADFVAANAAGIELAGARRAWPRLRCNRR